MLFYYFCMRCMFNDLFMFQTSCSYTRISSLPYSRFLPDTLGYEFSGVNALNNWSYLCKMLATLTTIATPRYSERVGISGDDVGRLLGPLFIVFFTSMIQTYFMLLPFMQICDYPCSESVQRGACQILRFNRLSTCVEAHWFRLHRIWNRLHRIFV